MRHISDSAAGGVKPRQHLGAVAVSLVGGRGIDSFQGLSSIAVYPFTGSVGDQYRRRVWHNSVNSRFPKRRNAGIPAVCSRRLSRVPFSVIGVAVDQRVEEPIEAARVHLSVAVDGRRIPHRRRARRVAF